MRLSWAFGISSSRTSALQGASFARQIRRFQSTRALSSRWESTRMKGSSANICSLFEKETDYSLPIIASLRGQGIRCEIYPEASKMKKQMQYANQKGIPFVIMTGETEMAEGKVMLKNMTTGEQTLLSPNEILTALK